jgi:iron complex outermembrane receptor protein
MKRERCPRSFTSKSTLMLTASAIFLCAPQVVHAQDADLPEDVVDASADEALVADQEVPAEGDIVVTGSRISGFTAPTPVTMLGEEELRSQAPSNIGDALTRLPSFRATSGPQIGGVTSRGGGQYFADLRGLGASRTLVLVDGRRYVPSGLTSSVDLNQIPTLLIERAEIVTGGASAAWGSDAVAGVLNLIIKKNLDGLIGEAQSGVSEQGDAAHWRIGLAGGTQFADGRGRVVIGGEFDRTYGADNQYSRDWGRREYNTIVNTAYATNGLPNYIISPNVRDSTLYAGGVVISGPLRGTAFGPDGTPFQFQYGQVFGSSMIGGTGFQQSRLRDARLASPIWRGNLLAHIDYDLTENLTAYVEASYARSQLTGNTTPPRDNAIVIRNDNPFLPAQTLAAMNRAGVTSITIGRVSLDFGDPPIENNTETYRGVLGLQGDLGGEWKWNAYAQYGRNRYNSFIFNNRINRLWTQAIDVTRDPATGRPICRSTLTSPGNGCRPVNVIGGNAISAEDVDWLSGTQEYLLFTSETVASAAVEGKPFNTWAGPVSIAFGAEYRREAGHATSDPISREVQPNGTIGGFLLGNPQPFDGAYDLYEFFGEGVVPLARDTKWAESLELNGAIRRTSYSTSGPVTTWKVGAIYEPISAIRLRATRSRDIRAPGLQDLFAPLFLAGYTPVLNDRTGLSPTTARYNVGNPDLQPEKADTWTAGIVVRPFSGLQISADYYNVRIEDAIASTDAGSVAARCYAGVQEFCRYINRDAAGNIAHVIQPTLNLFSAKTEGLDLDASYNFRLGAGRMGLRAIATRVFNFVSTDLAGIDDRVGQLSNHLGETGVPKWAGVGTIAYDLDRFSADLQLRYVGSGVFNTSLVEGAGAANTINDNSIPSRTYVSLSVRYDVMRDEAGESSAQMFGVVSNLFDKDPPFVPANGGGGANATSTNPAFYDTIGRSYRVGVRFSF